MLIVYSFANTLGGDFSADAPRWGKQSLCHTQKGLNIFKIASFDFHSLPLPPLTPYPNVVVWSNLEV